VVASRKDGGLVGFAVLPSKVWDWAFLVGLRYLFDVEKGLLAGLKRTCRVALP
jgi:hypothetical protein